MESELLWPPSQKNKKAFLWAVFFNFFFFFFFFFFAKGSRLQRFGLALKVGWALRISSSPVGLKRSGRICLKKELSQPSALAFALLTVAGVCFEA